MKLLFNRNSLILLLVSMCFFTLSLDSFGDRRLGFVFVFISIALFLHIGQVKFNIKTIGGAVLLLSLLLVLVLLSYFEVFGFKNNIAHSPLSFILGLMMKIFIALIVFSLLDFDRIRLSDVIHYSIVLHLVVFCFQYVLVYAGFGYLDVMVGVTGTEQRYLSNFTLPFIGDVYRPTGFYLEPSTYATFMLILVFCKTYLKGETSKFDTFCVISTLFTLSTAALVYSLLYLLIILFFKGGKCRILVYSLAPFLVSASYFLFEIRNEDTSGAISNVRVKLLESIFNQDINNIIFGSGLLGLPDEIAYYVNNDILGYMSFSALNDLGVWAFILIKTGILGLFLFCMFIMFFLNNTKERALFSTLLLTKINYLSPIFIFLVTIILVFSKRTFVSSVRMDISCMARKVN